MPHHRQSVSPAPNPTAPPDPTASLHHDTREKQKNALTEQQPSPLYNARPNRSSFTNIFPANHEDKENANNDDDMSSVARNSWRRGTSTCRTTTTISTPKMSGTSTPLHQHTEARPLVVPPAPLSPHATTQSRFTPTSPGVVRSGSRRCKPPSDGINFSSHPAPLSSHLEKTQSIVTSSSREHRRPAQSLKTRRKDAKELSGNEGGSGGRSIGGSFGKPGNSDVRAGCRVGNSSNSNINSNNNSSNNYRSHLKGAEYHHGVTVSLCPHLLRRRQVAPTEGMRCQLFQVQGTTRCSRRPAARRMPSLTHWKTVRERSTTLLEQTVVP